MPKKAKAKAGPPPGKEAAVAAPAAAQSKAAQEEEERLANEKLYKERAEANRKKAEQAQAHQLRQNQRQLEWEREQQKSHEKKEREERKWTKELEKVKARAKAEGVLESEDWGDGVWWVKIDPVHYKEVKGEFFCPLCEKHLCSGSLEAHLNSDTHKRRIGWTQPPQAGAGTGAAAGAGAAASSASARPATGPSAAPAAPSCPRASPAGATPWGGWPNVNKEDWMEESPDGFLRCIPCGKVVDDNHLAKDDHQNRLARWQEEQRAKKYGREAPALQYLAYVPWDESDPNSERNLKCLLCNKWVQDATSHSGTRQAPAGAKDHQKNLRNYGPGEHWYEENVVRVRQKWHPDARPPPPTVSMRQRQAEVIEA